jgi:hypothetical protein
MAREITVTREITREEWLNRMTEALRPAFLEAGGEIPEKVRVTCGWPSRSGRAKKKRRIGECWSSENSKDEHFEIFISPTLFKIGEVTETLVHELVHTAVGVKEGHKAAFRKVAVKLGLEGKMTETHAGDELHDRLEALASKVGPYPHAELTFGDKKVQGTRMIKVICPDPACGFHVRTTRKWLDLGTPTCFCGSKMEEVEADV